MKQGAEKMIFRVLISEKRAGEGMTDIRYWLWFTMAMQERHELKYRIWQEEPDVEILYHMKREDYMAAGFDNKRVLDLLSDKSMDRVERELEFAAQHRVELIAYDNENYPERLKEIPNPPLVLYRRGKHLEDCLELAIAIVGTRKCTDYGRECAFTLARDLAKAGFTIVSGMAEGIDGCAHRGALDAQGKTIAVLGSGVNKPYPAIHRDLMVDIMNNGCAVSEFPFDAKPLKHHFPLRNRIISGLALGAIAVEGGDISGASITIHHANEQSRETFAVPGNINQEKSRLCNRLIARGEAKLITSADDVIEEFETVYGHLLHKEEAAQQEEVKQLLTDEEKKILSLLHNGPQQLEELCRLTGMNVAELGMHMTMLEMKHVVYSMPGKYFGLQK